MRDQSTVNFQMSVDQEISWIRLQGCLADTYYESAYLSYNTVNEECQQLSLGGWSPDQRANITMAMMEPPYNHTVSENVMLTLSGQKSNGPLHQHPPKSISYELVKLVTFESPHFPPFACSPMTNLDIKLKLANTVATIVLIGSHGFSFQDW